jgi:hypothetical protein
MAEAEGSSKRMSSVFRKFSTFRKKDKDSVNGTTNGATNGVNGVHGTNGISHKRRQSQHEKATSDVPDHGKDRETISETFAQFAQLIHASQRPMPTQTGDGSYIEKENTGSVMADLRSMGFKDFKTLKDVFENKSKGELTDDKTYLMERVIQVSSF